MEEKSIFYDLSDEDFNYDILNKPYLKTTPEYIDIVSKWPDLTRDEARIIKYLKYIKQEEIEPEILSGDIFSFPVKGMRCKEEKEEEIIRAKYLSEVLQTRPSSFSTLKIWWSSLSTIKKVRTFPREFLAFSTFCMLLFTIFLLLSGIIIDRVILAPDFGVVLIIILSTLWMMTQVAKLDMRKKRHG